MRRPLLYRVRLVERSVNGTAEFFTVINADAALLVNIYAKIPGHALFLKTYIPDGKTEFIRYRANNIPDSGDGVPALAF